MKVKIQLFAVMLCLVLSLSVNADEFRILTGMKAPLFDYYEAIEKEVFKRIGHTVNQSHIPAGRAIELINDGIYDGDCCRIRKITKIYPNTVLVPESIFTLHFTAFTKDNLNIKRWADIKPYNVASVEGFKLIQIKTNEVAPKSFLSLPDSTAMFRMLDSGRIDIAMLNYVDAERIIKQLGLDNIRVTLPALSTVPVYLTLHKKNAYLVNDLKLALIAMKEDGTFFRLRKKFFKSFKLMSDL